MTTASKNPKGSQDRAITFLTQEEVQRLFSAIKTKRDRATDSEAMPAWRAGAAGAGAIVAAVMATVEQR